MTNDFTNQCAAACESEDAGTRALRDARRRVLDHIGSASKELGDITAQYGRLIGNYKIELAQIDSTLDRLSLRTDSIPSAPSVPVGGLATTLNRPTP